MRNLNLSLASSLLLIACSHDPNVVQVDLAPSLISSLDGTTTVSAIAADDATPVDGVMLHMAVEYTDRNGMPHAIAPADSKTDARGVAVFPITGLQWDGVGTVTVTQAAGVSGSATFAVLDRTPPAITILPPTTNLHVGPGLPLDVQVHVTDEIGVSQVVLDGTGAIRGRQLNSVIASGKQDVTITFRIDIPNGATPGPTIELHALASDLSGNLATAAPITLIVDPLITIATPPGLMGSLLTDGTAQRLVDPRAIVMSPRDSHLYVADVAGAGSCNPSCVWRIDPTTGTIDAAPIVVGVGDFEGIAVDATGDTLYLSDRTDRIARLTWNGSAYVVPGTNPVCNDVTANQPADPFHLVFDATLGIVVTDDNDRNVQTIATCSATSTGQALSAMQSFDQPRGIALGPTGLLYVSDNAQDRVSQVNRTTGAVTVFQDNIAQPYGIEWLAGGTTSFADTLMVTSMNDRTVESTKGMGTLAAAYLRNDPIDLAIATGTMYILTAPSAGNKGRIYKVTGF